MVRKSSLPTNNNAGACPNNGSPTSFIVRQTILNVLDHCPPQSSLLTCSSSIARFAIMIKSEPKLGEMLLHLEVHRCGVNLTSRAGDQFGYYKVGQELAQGAEGDVFAAVRIRPDGGFAQVALKRIRSLGTKVGQRITQLANTKNTQHCHGPTGGFIMEVLSLSNCRSRCAAVLVQMVGSSSPAAFPRSHTVHRLSTAQASRVHRAFCRCSRERPPAKKGTRSDRPGRRVPRVGKSPITSLSGARPRLVSGSGRGR